MPGRTLCSTLNATQSSTEPIAPREREKSAVVLLSAEEERELDGVAPEWRGDLEPARPGLRGFFRVPPDLGRCLRAAEGVTLVHTVDGLEDCLEHDPEPLDE